MYGCSGVCYLFFIKESIESPLKIALFVVIAAQLPRFPRQLDQEFNNLWRA